MQTVLAMVVSGLMALTLGGCGEASTSTTTTTSVPEAYALKTLALPGRSSVESITQVGKYLVILTDVVEVFDARLYATEPISTVSTPQILLVTPWNAGASNRDGLAVIEEFCPSLGPCVDFYTLDNLANGSSPTFKVLALPALAIPKALCALHDGIAAGFFTGLDGNFGMMVFNNVSKPQSSTVNLTTDYAVQSCLVMPGTGALVVAGYNVDAVGYNAHGVSIFGAQKVATGGSASAHLQPNCSNPSLLSLLSNGDLVVGCFSQIQIFASAALLSGGTPSATIQNHGYIMAILGLSNGDLAVATAGQYYGYVNIYGASAGNPSWRLMSRLRVWHEFPTALAQLVGNRHIVVGSYGKNGQPYNGNTTVVDVFELPASPKDVGAEMSLV